MKCRQLLFLLVLFCDLAVDARTQEKLVFDRITTEHGLPNGAVSAIFQDSSGFMWFGTADGLCRFDGLEFRVFRSVPGNPRTISSNQIWSVTQDQKGHLWIGTFDGGLNSFNPAIEEFTRHSRGDQDSTYLSSLAVRGIVPDGRGNLWVGTFGGGLLRFDIATGRFEPALKGVDTLSDPYIRTLYSDDQRTLWIGTRTALHSFETTGGHLTRYVHNPAEEGSIIAGAVGAVVHVAAGKLWIGTRQGVCVLRDNSFKRIGANTVGGRALQTADVLAIEAIADGSIWIGSFNSGIFRIDPMTGAIDQFSHDPDDPLSLIDNGIRSLYVDRRGILWVGTNNGVCMINQKRKRFHSIANVAGNLHGLGPGEIQALLEDNQGRLWVGTSTGGLFTLSNRSGKFEPVDLEADFITKIIQDRAGDIWVGTFSRGLVRINGRSGQQTFFTSTSPAPLRINDNSISTLCEDSRGWIWVGYTMDGLEALDQTRQRRISFRHNPNDSTSISSNRIHIITQDHFGDLYVGTEGGGINILPSGKATFRRLTAAGSTATLSDNLVYAINEDRGGNLWVGTSRGLNLYDRTTGEFRQYFSGISYASDYIRSILSDERGNLWLSTTKGILRFNPATGNFNHFGTDDGLLGMELTNAAFRRKDGTIYVGGKLGINYFHPDSVVIDSFPPKVHVVSFSVHQTPVLPSSIADEKGTLILEHSQNNLGFEFACLDYASPTKVQYAYLMENVDRTWVHNGVRRHASYTNLDPGRYVLHVRAANGDGVWNTAGASLDIEIRPPYWETWWFRSLAVITLAGVVTIAYNVRVRRLLEMERMRVRIASDLHDDIGSSLGSIALLSDMVRTKAALPEAESKQLTEISMSARHTAEALRDIVWVINPEHDKIDNLVLRMKDAANLMLRKIPFSFACESTHLAGIVDMEFRRNMLLIYKEAIHNIVKHSDATNVEIHISERDGNLIVRVADNGKGFDTMRAGGGNGMRTLRARAEKLGGQLAIESSPGAGTSVIFTARIP